MRAVRWLLVALLAETAVGLVLGATGTPGHAAVAACPLTALVVWRTVVGLPLHELFGGCAPRWVVVAAAAELAVQGAAALVLRGGGRAGTRSCPTDRLDGAPGRRGGPAPHGPARGAGRGALLRLVTSASGWPVALTTTSVPFALAHLPRVLSQRGGLDPPYLLGLAVFAISLAVPARSVGSIWPAPGTPPPTPALR